MPDGYDKDRAPFDDNNTRGRIFERGANEYFGDHEKGYLRHTGLFKDQGRSIQFDKVRTDSQGRVYSIEEKSGRIDGPKDDKQLKVVRSLIEKGVIQGHVLRSVEGEYVSKAAQKLIDGLNRDFPDRFTHQIISRDDARQIWALGIQREPGQQLEITGVREQARQQTRQREQPAVSLVKQRKQPRVSLVRSEKQQQERADRQRQREQRARGRQLREAKARLERTVADQLRWLAEAREQGTTVPVKELRDAHRSLAKQLAAVRGMEDAQARALLERNGLSQAQIQQIEPVLRERREAQRKGVVRGIDSIGNEVRQQDWAQELEQHNVRAKQRGVEHVQQVEAQSRGHGHGYESQLRVEQAQRQAERLVIDPGKVAELDIDIFRAVRDGRSLGYDTSDKTHTYQQAGKPPVKVAHDAPERQLAELTKNVEKGLSLDLVLGLDVMNNGHNAPVIEAARSRSIDPPMPTQGIEEGRERDRSLHRDR
ncbi:hypothetical protein [Nocardia sp. NPDC050710]|uniref:hypothetical protein n=1 Tax=Nocardia sp. NPDC050710 TaxID=3157220 RepID=UPI0033D77D29